MSSYFEKKAPTREKAKIHPFSFRELPQVDLVPTLSLLFGLPVPKNNLGKIIAELFTSHSGKVKKICILLLFLLTLLDLHISLNNATYGC